MVDWDGFRVYNCKEEDGTKREFLWNLASLCDLFRVTWQVFVTFLGWLGRTLSGVVGDLQIGDEKVTLNHHIAPLLMVYNL